MVDAFWLARARVVGFAAIEERKNGTGHPQWVTRAVDAPAITEARAKLVLIPLFLGSKGNPLAAGAAPEEESKDERDEVDDLCLDEPTDVEAVCWVESQNQRNESAEE